MQQLYTYTTAVNTYSWGCMQQELRHVWVWDDVCVLRWMLELGRHTLESLMMGLLQNDSLTDLLSTSLWLCMVATNLLNQRLYRGTFASN